MTISVIIITKNEEKMIADCLKSITWADETIVVDTGNTDKTNSIAKKFDAKVIKYTGYGSFADWRNFGAKHAAGDWLFYIDADERATDDVKKELLNKLPDSDFDAYAIPRRNFIFGQEFKFSGQYPDYQKRILQKKSLKKWVGDVHEEPDFSGNLDHLKNPLLHYKNMTITQMVEKTNKWSEIEAKLMYAAGHPPMNIMRFLSATAREFWKRMFIELAFLDGPKGIIYAIYQVFSKFVSYAKLYELQIKK